MRKILIALLLTSFASQAQIIFEKGYFISNTGKRTECYIKNVDWKNNPTDFSYKLNLADAEFIVETADKISEFGIDNVSKFRKFNVKIERSSVNANRLTKNKAPNFKEETLLLNVLIEGDANLYVYNDGMLTKFFFDKKDHPIEQLVYIRYATQTGEAAENNQFRQQLLNNLSKGNVTEDDFKKIKYKQAELVKVFEKYNNTGRSAMTKFERKATVKPFAFKIATGLVLSSLELEVPHLRYNETAKDINTDSELTFKVGFEAEYKLPFNKNKWRFFVAPTYSKFKTDYDFNAIDIYGDPKGNTVSASFALIEIPIGVRHYFYLNENSKIFVDAAYAVNLFSQTEITYNKADNPVTLEEFDQRGSLVLGIGYNYRKFAASLSLGMPKKFYADAYLCSYKTTSLLISYEIF